MKKLMLLVLIIGAIVFTACSKDDDSSKSCLTLTSEVTDAATAYSEDFSAVHCQEYKEALQALIDGNCLDDNDGTMQLILSGLNCSE